MKKLYLACMMLFASITVSIAQWTTSGDNVFYNTGNVGIGINNPDSRLSVSGIPDTPVVIIRNGGHKLIMRNESPAQHKEAFKLVYRHGSYDNAFISFYMGSDWTNGALSLGNKGAERIKIDHTGLVSIPGNFKAEGYNAPVKINQIGYNAILRLCSGTSNATLSEIMTVTYDGKLGIGTTSPDHKLDVTGNIRAHKVLVNADKTADFVFDKDYRLPALEKVEEYISVHGHLPEIAPADDMRENGIDMGTFQIQLLQKIEELTLYIIEQQKEISILRKQNDRITELEEQVALFRSVMSKSENVE